MKKAFIVYYADKSANVVLATNLQEVSTVVGDKKFMDVVKVDVIPFEVL